MFKIFSLIYKIQLPVLYGNSCQSILNGSTTDKTHSEMRSASVIARFRHNGRSLCFSSARALIRLFVLSLSLQYLLACSRRVLSTALTAIVKIRKS